MSDKNHDILGVYSYVDLLLDSIKELRSKGFESIQVFTPCPNHEIEDALDTGKEPSKVKYFTFCGAILGALVGASFTVLTSMDWPIVTSAKPIVSIPPYMIIIFECMILIGGLSTFLGLIINSRLRKNVAPHLYDERFSNDKFGILVNCSSENLEEVESILNKNGSEEIKIDGKVLEKEEAQLEEEQIVEEVKQEASKKEDRPKVEEPAPQEEAKTSDNDDWGHKSSAQGEVKKEVKTEEPKAEEVKEEAPPKVEHKVEEVKEEAPPKEEPKAEEVKEVKTEQPKQNLEDEKKKKMARLMQMAKKSQGDKKEPKAEEPAPQQEVKTFDDDDWDHKPATKKEDKDT